MKYFSLFILRFKISFVDLLILKIKDMIVRFENIRKSSNYSVVDELNKYLGDISEVKMIDLIYDSREIEEDEYTFYVVEKELLFNFLSAE